MISAVFFGICFTDWYVGVRCLYYRVETLSVFLQLSVKRNVLVAEQNLLWQYLNKDAHEKQDRDDFDEE